MTYMLSQFHQASHPRYSTCRGTMLFILFCSHFLSDGGKLEKGVLIDGKWAVSRNIIASCQCFHVNFISSSALISTERYSICGGMSFSLMPCLWVMACAFVAFHYNADSLIAFPSGARRETGAIRLHLLAFSCRRTPLHFLAALCAVSVCTLPGEIMQQIYISFCRIEVS